MALDGLKIKVCPYAFADMARQHNALVEMLAATKGQNGVTVTISERNMIISGGGTSNASNSANYEARFTAIESNVATLQANITTLTANVSSLSSNVSGLQSNVSTLQSNVSTLNTLTSGLSRQTVTLCSNGSPANVTILRS